MQWLQLRPMEVPEGSMDHGFGLLPVRQEEVRLLHLCPECFEQSTRIHASKLQQRLLLLQLLEKIVLIFVYLRQILLSSLL